MSHSTPAPHILGDAAPFESSDAAPTKPTSYRSVARLTLSALALLAIAASYWQPFWTFELYAPQYPHGLTLTISLTGFDGDVREIDMLNHYIGMASLQQGAALERRYAALLVSMLVSVLAVLAVLPGRKNAVLAAAVGAAYPLGFLADTSYWMYRFGHQLDPRAPLHIPQFTPQLFGNGTIGQFMTFAVPQLGFGLSILGAVLLLGAAVCSRSSQEAPCCNG